MYITDLSAITPQKTYKKDLNLSEFTEHTGHCYQAMEPDYSDMIPKGLLRRMGKAVRLGTGVGMDLISKHSDLDGIIIGTASGGLEDCFKFLDQIVKYEEGRLTPTNFVQSTPNAVAGQIAMMSQTRGYNITYTNGGHSFEDALLDTSLLLKEGSKKLLIGGLEEISEQNLNIDQLAGIYKKEEVSNLTLLDTNTTGSICGEGCCMFVVEQSSSNYYAKILDVHTTTYLDIEELDSTLIDFLSNNNLSLNDIDNLILGKSGDIRHNVWYDSVAESMPKTNQYTFKNYVGEYRTASSFAVWLACHILTDETISENLILKTVSNNRNYTLIYNHFNEIEHSFILLSK